MLSDPEDDQTDQDRAAELGVNRVTLYRWRRDPEFQARLAAQREAMTRAWRTQVRVALIRAALSGDVAAIRLFETLAGEVTERGEYRDRLDADDATTAAVEAIQELVAAALDPMPHPQGV